MPSEIGKTRVKRSFDRMSQNWIALVGLCSLPIFIVIGHFIGEARFMATYLSTGIIAVVIYYFWDLRKRIWFWTTMVVIATLHVLFVLFLPLPDRQWNYLRRVAHPFSLDFLFLFLRLWVPRPCDLCKGGNDADCAMGFRRIPKPKQPAASYPPFAQSAKSGAPTVVVALSVHRLGHPPIATTYWHRQRRTRPFGKLRAGSCTKRKDRAPVIMTASAAQRLGHPP